MDTPRSSRSDFRRPVDIKTYEIFGLTFQGSARSEGGAFSGEEESERGVLDLAKVHSVQKSLVRFSERASELIDALENPRGPSPSPAAAGRLTDLALESQRLALQLACIAPLSPLKAEPGISSSISGLDALIQEVSGIV